MAGLTEVVGFRGELLGPEDAWAQAGLLWGELDQATQRFGLATTGGIVTHTGVAGLTLGGGIGWLMRRHGLTCDNLLAVELVTADGRRVRADGRTHPELFWGVRGGGGNFGVVTAFQFRLHEVGPRVLAGPVLYPAEQAGQVLRGYRNWAADAPDEVSTVVNLRLAPPLPIIPERLHGVPVVTIVCCYAGADPDAGQRLLAPVRRLGTPLLDLVTVKPYAAHQATFDATVPHGLHYYWRSHYLDELGDGAIDTLADHAWSHRSPWSYTILFQLGGAVGRVPGEATPVRARQPLARCRLSWPVLTVTRAGPGWTCQPVLPPGWKVTCTVTTSTGPRVASLMPATWTRPASAMVPRASSWAAMPDGGVAVARSRGSTIRAAKATTRMAATTARRSGRRVSWCKDSSLLRGLLGRDTEDARLDQKDQEVNFETSRPAGALWPGAGERAQADPPAEGAAQVAAAGEGYRPVTERMGDGEVAQVHLGERAHVGGDAQVGVEPGVGQAQVDLGPVQDQPEVALVGVAEVELDGHPFGRQPVDLDAAPQEPHQQPGVQVVGPQLLGRPLVAPPAQGLHHRAEGQPGRAQVVLEAPPGPVRAPLDQPGSLQGSQPLRQQGPRDAGQPPLQLAEPVAAGEQLAQDQRRPALGEHLGPERHRAELAIPSHARSLGRSHRPVKFIP
jgi:FAD binding domain